MEYPQFVRLVEVIKSLRDPEHGCPWDLEQTHKSLLTFLLEECYEFIHAAEEGDDRLMEEELGDILLQVLLHGQIAEERNSFTLESVSKVLADKMIRRHPHVFDRDNSNASNSKEVMDQWEEIKDKEKKSDTKDSSIMDRSYLSFPSLYSSYKIGLKSNKVNFDWDDAYQVCYKVEEEWQELKEELVPGKPKNMDRVVEELGDFLFSIAQLARHLGVNPEESLRNANKKFMDRFQKMEAIIKESGKEMSEMSQEEMDVYWDEVKRNTNAT